MGMVLKRLLDKSCLPSATQYSPSPNADQSLGIVLKHMTVPSLKFRNLISQVWSCKGKRKAEEIVFFFFVTVVDMCWPWHNHKAINAATDKEVAQQVGRCLARTIGSDMTNPQIPGRKWHTVESLRGLESHIRQRWVHPWRKGSYFTNWAHILIPV